MHACPHTALGEGLPPGHYCYSYLYTLLAPAASVGCLPVAAKLAVGGSSASNVQGPPWALVGCVRPLCVLWLRAMAASGPDLRRGRRHQVQLGVAAEPQHFGPHFAPRQEGKRHIHTLLLLYDRHPILLEMTCLLPPINQVVLTVPEAVSKHARFGPRRWQVPARPGGGLAATPRLASGNSMSGGPRGGGYKEDDQQRTFAVELSIHACICVWATA